MSRIYISKREEDIKQINVKKLQNKYIDIHNKLKDLLINVNIDSNNFIDQIFSFVDKFYGDLNCINKIHDTKYRKHFNNNTKLHDIRQIRIKNTQEIQHFYPLSLISSQNCRDFIHFTDVDPDDYKKIYVYSISNAIKKEEVMKEILEYEKMMNLM